MAQTKVVQRPRISVLVVPFAVSVLACTSPEPRSESSDESESESESSEDTGDEPALDPLPIDRAVLLWTRSEGEGQLSAYEISSPDASPLAWRLEDARALGPHFVTHGSGEDSLTESLRFDAEGLLELEAIPSGLPTRMVQPPTFGPDGRMALAQLGDAGNLYTLEFDAAGELLGGRLVFSPPPGDGSGDYVPRHLALSETHAVFALDYLGSSEGELSTVAVWGLALDGVSTATELASFPPIPDDNPSFGHLVGDHFVYNDRGDSPPALYAGSLLAPNEPPRLICPAADSDDHVQVLGSPFGDQLLCTRRNSPAHDLYHVDLDEPEPTPEWIAGNTLGFSWYGYTPDLLHAAFLSPDRVVYATRPSSFDGPSEKAGALMLVERIEGIWQAPLPLSAEVLDPDGGIYGWKIGAGGVLYTAIDAGSNTLNWIDLSSPAPFVPLRLHEGFHGVPLAVLPDIGTHLAYTLFLDGADRLFSLDVSDPIATPLDLSEGLPDAWRAQDRTPVLIEDDRQVLFEARLPTAENFFARVAVDGSWAPVAVSEAIDASTEFRAELIRVP